MLEETNFYSLLEAGWPSLNLQQSKYLQNIGAVQQLRRQWECLVGGQIMVSANGTKPDITMFLTTNTHEKEYRNVSIYIFYSTSSIILWVYHKNTHTSCGCVIFLFGQLLESRHSETSKCKETSWVGSTALRKHFKLCKWLRTAKIPQEKHHLLHETWSWTMLIYFWTWTVYYLLFYSTFLKHAHHF